MRIVAVTAAEKPELWRHLQDYMRELLPYGGQLAPADGDLPYGHFDAYWREPETCWPFWGMRDHRRAGFALVRKGSGRMEMAEFYCFPQFRRTGVGLAFARELLGRFPGPWEITQFAEHAGAVEILAPRARRYAVRREALCRRAIRPATPAPKVRRATLMQMKRAAPAALLCIWIDVPVSRRRSHAATSRPFSAWRPRCPSCWS